MTRDEVASLLRLRRMHTGEQFDANGEKIDAWYTILCDYPNDRITARYHELIRAGHEKISLPALTGGIPRPHTQPDDEPERYEGPYLAADHPTARAAFARGYHAATGRQP
jgi:hypothetical protein